MNTFDAINHIRRQSLSRTEAVRFLIENLGFSAAYADEVVAVIFSDQSGKPGQSMQSAAAG